MVWYGMVMVWKKYVMVWKKYGMVWCCGVYKIQFFWQI
jgi:hypothetical protein